MELAIVAFLIGLAAGLDVPSLDVPECALGRGSIEYHRSDPNGTSFPPTQVDVCYGPTHINLVFTAFDESNFYYNVSQTTNEAIWQYEVMEAFIYRGIEDPETYLEFEVNPHNVTYQAFIYNPSKLRLPGTPFDHFFITHPTVDGLSTKTTLDRRGHLWMSDVRIPLGLFNVNSGHAKGTRWRMNFFRTVTSPNMFPSQLLGAWSPTNESNFHETPFFGHVHFT